MKSKDKGRGLQAQISAELGRRADADSGALLPSERDARLVEGQNEAARALLLHAMPWLPEESCLVEVARAATLILMRRDELRRELDDTLSGS